ncbi:MAG: hypothetical protein GXO50_01830 [Chlorobi bacterium]|nr:hypothetical protein [Chlorobiota bacterium]
MTTHFKMISDYLDGNMTKAESVEFLMQTGKNKLLKEDFVLMSDLNSHMKGKRLVETAEDSEDLKNLEIQARKDVEDFLYNGKNDAEILSILATAFPGHSEDVSMRIREAEAEAALTGIDKAAEDWVSDFMFESGEQKRFSLYENDKSRTEKFIHDKLKYAAIAAALAAPFVINNMFEGKYDNERIFSQYHGSPEKISTARIRNTDFKSDISFEKAVELYNTGKYIEAYSEFGKTLSANKNFIQAKYYSALSLFEAGKYKEAAKIFEQILNSSELYRLESEWYSALIYIKEGKTGKAIPYLKEVASQKNLHKEDAEKILKTLE